jgi:hypothetical protein
VTQGEFTVKNHHIFIRQSRKFAFTVLAALSVSLLTALSLRADVDILVVGSTHSFSEGGESGVVHEKPFDPTDIASELQSILANDTNITETVNVVVEDIYTNKTISLYYDSVTLEDQERHCYSLAQYYMWPEGKASRRANLRGESTPWDYVVIMADPYVMANFPGMFADGANMLINEIRSGTAEPILMAQWPENSSSNTASYFNEIVYRVGDSAAARVVPAGKAWDSYSSQDSSADHPTPHGAYMAAASIYSELFNRSAKTSGYTYASTPTTTAIADHALSNIQTNAGVSQYSGSFTNITVFSMKYVPKRLVSYNWTGSSTEWHTEWALLRLDDRCGMTFTTTATHDPTDWDFNMGRGNDRFEDDKDYSVNPSLYDRSYGLPMHDYYMSYASNTMPYGIDKQYRYGSTYDDGTDLGIAYNMIRPGTRETSLPADVRAIPLRLMYTKMLEYAPSMNPLADDNHMNYNLDDASAAFIYTLLSGRCPLVDEPSPVNETMSSAWMQWLGNKIGYETAWRLAHVTTRVPGFQVLPSGQTATDVTPSVSEPLSVRFWYAPTSDVTVAVSVDDRFAGKVSPTELTFTPSNYTNAQTVTVLGETGSAGTYEFNVTLTTASDDAIYAGISDTWDFSNTRPEGPAPSDVRITWDGMTIISGDMTPDAATGTDFGVTTGSVVHTFAITNLSDSTTHNLTNSPRVTLTGDSEFLVTQNAQTGSIAPESATPFEITYSPSTAGTHTGLVVVASTDATTPVYSFAISGLCPSSPTVTNAVADAVDETSATVSGVLQSGGSADAWICWGTTDAGTINTGLWDHVDAIGTVTDGVSFSNLVSGLSSNATYWYRCYVENDAGEDWADIATSFSGTPVDDSGVAGLAPVMIGEPGFESASGSGGGVSVPPWKRSTGATTIAIGSYSSLSAKLDDFPDGGLYHHYANSAGDSIYQILSTNLAANTKYTLSMVAIDRNDQTFQSSELRMGYVPGTDDGSTGDMLANDFYGEYLLTGAILTNTVPVNGAAADDGYVTWVTEFITGASPAGEGAPLRIEVVGSGVQSLYDNVALTQVDLASDSIINGAPTNLTSTGGSLNATLNFYSAAGYDIYVCYGDSNAVTNAEAWAETDYVGSWTNVQTEISYTASNLTAGQTYYYTFMASNATKMVWATPSWQFTMPGEPVPTFDLTVVSEHGTAVPSGLTTPASNSVVNASIIDSPVWNGNTQYVCTGWVATGSAPAIGSTTNMSFTITNDTTITWLWNTNITTVYTVIFDVGVNGARTGGGALTQSVAEATSAALPTITPNAGYTFAGWDSMAYTNVTSNMTINAQYSLIEYTLTYNAGANGSISGTQTQTLNYGNSGSAVEAIPDGGYHFVDWSDSSTDNPRTDTGITSDLTVTANFAVDTPPVIDNGVGATNLTETSAQLSGELTSGVSGSAWVCWGLTDAGISSTGDWANVTLVGAVNQGEPFATNITSLATNTTYFYRCYATNAYGTDWSDNAIAFSGTQAGGTGSAWTPAEIDTVAWYDADDSGTITESGGLVSQWNDKSGNENNAIQASVGLQPQYQTDALNGKPVVLFDGSDDVLPITGSFGLQETYIVLNANDGANFTAWRWPLGGWTAWDNRTAAFWASSGSSDFNCTSGILYLNGTTGGTSSMTFAPLSDYKVAGGLRPAPVASRSDWKIGDGDDNWKGGIAEIIVLPTASTTEDRQKLEGYLAHKWGLEGSLPGDHPYKSTPPGGSGPLANLPPTNITSSSASFNASLIADSNGYDAYVYYGTTDGGTNASAWASTNFVGSYTNATTNVSYNASLVAGQTNYYTFMVSNEIETVWATPSWHLTMPNVARVVTTNYSVPYAWIDLVATNTITDYEAAVTNDPDGDGFTTAQEYWSGTDPFSESSYLRIANVAFTDGSMRLQWNHDRLDSNIPPLRVQVSTNLFDNQWQDAPTNTNAPVEGVNQWQSPYSDRRFYRLIVTPTP